MHIVIDALKVVAALAFLVGIGYYWINQGPPPRGRGRWRDILDKLEGDRRKRKK